MTGLDRNLLLDARDTSGNLIAKRVNEQPELATGNPVNFFSKPGVTLMEQQNIAAACDMTKPGNVHLYRFTENFPTAHNVKTNKLTMVVRPSLP
jgi:hypothetical protein